MPLKRRKTQCRQCGSTNFGIQTDCLICHTRLPDQSSHQDLGCGKCGATLRPGSQACTQCGHKISPATPPPAIPLTCRNTACRAPLRAGKTFCTQCGTPATN